MTGYVEITTKTATIFFITLLIIIATVFFLFGLNQGMKRLEMAQQFGHDMAILEYSTVHLQQTGVTFCSDQGEIFLAEIIKNSNPMYPKFKSTAKF